MTPKPTKRGAEKWILIHLHQAVLPGRRSMKKMRSLAVLVGSVFRRMKVDCEISLSLTSTFMQGEMLCDLVIIRMRVGTKAFERFLREQSMWLRAFGKVATANFASTKAVAPVRHG